MIHGFLGAEPTTAYLLTFTPGRCLGHCAFCAQSTLSKSPMYKLARVAWPEFDSGEVIDRLGANPGLFSRLCIQTLNYPSFFEALKRIIDGLKEASPTPISVSCQPLSDDQIVELRGLGVERLSIPLDGASPKVFEDVKGSGVGGPYRWRMQVDAISKAVHVFGEGNVTTHVIIGLGETDREVVNLLWRMIDTGVLTSLFAFTPIKGTVLENKRRPSLARYRALQTINYLMNKHELTRDSVVFDDEDRVKKIYVSKRCLSIIGSGEPFRTFGCPGCNRPYYNENVSGPIYNYPMPLNAEETQDAMALLKPRIQSI